MPQGVCGAIKKRRGFQPFRELGRVAGRRNPMEIPRRKILSDWEFPQARWCFARQSTLHTLQAIQVVVDYSGWHLPDGPMPQRGGGIAGSLNEAQWFYAPTGRKGIAQGKVTRRPGILPLSRSSPSLSSRLGSPWRTWSTVSLAMPIRGSSDGSFLAFPRATARSMIYRRASLVLSRNAVGFNRFANLDASQADEIGWRFPDVRFQRSSGQGGWT